MIIHERESKTLEFKSGLPKMHNLIKTCIAFANGIGGRIIIGVDDQSREVIGVTEDLRDEIYEKLLNSLYDSSTPNILAHVYDKRFGEALAVIIEVSESHQKPCYITREGIPDGVYLRVGSSTRRANNEYIADLIRESERKFYDEERVIEDYHVLHQELLEKFYTIEYNNIRRLLTDKIVRKSNINHEILHPTITGLLHFHQQPDQLIPEAMIICTRFSGISGRNIIQTEEVTGCIEQQIRISLELIKSWITRNYKLQAARLEGQTLIPEVALREAIINAVIHRKYSIPAPIKIALYDDRLEIFSPGNFPGLIDLKNLGDGMTYLRNPNIAKIARKMKLLEKLGSGIRLIFDSCAQARLKTPQYYEDGDFVKIIFYFANAADRQLNTNNSKQNKILDLLDVMGEVTISRAMEHLDVSRNTVTRRMNKLIAAGIVVRVGHGKSIRYILQ